MKRLFFIAFLVSLLSSPFGYAGPDPRGILELDGYSNGDAVGVNATRTRGDFMEKAAVKADDCLFHVKASGYNGTAIGTNPNAKITLNATQTWTSTANGTDIRFFTTPNGSATMAEIVRISSNTNVGIGTTNPTSTLDVGTGSIAATTVTVSGLLLIPANAAPRTNVTPPAAGYLIRNTGLSPNGELCYSTGTTVTSWVKVATPTVACSN